MLWVDFSKIDVNITSMVMEILVVLSRSVASLGGVCPGWGILLFGW